MTDRYELPISEAELLAMTSAMEELHQESMPQVRSELAGLTERVRSTVTRVRPSRRTFLVGGLAIAGGSALAACSKSNGSSGTGASTAASASTQLTGDLRVVGLATALENLAVAAYGLALQNAQAGKLGTVPPAVGVFAMTAKMQHQDHANAWNSVLTGAGKKAVTTPALTITTAQVAQLNSARNIGDVAKQALALENIAAQTYLTAEAGVTDPGGVKVAASIAPVEAMHAAILHYVLGQYPVPDNFIGTSMALGVDVFQQS